MREHSKRLAGLAIAVIATCCDPRSLLAACDSEAACTCPHVAQSDSCSRAGRWFVVQTVNFQVCCDESEVRARGLARHAEKLRTDLRKQWFGEESTAVWSPKCQIVLHSSRQSFVAEVGRGSDRILGSSLVTCARGRVTRRRIDLLGGGQYLNAALPHELTHVVLQERLAGELPHWADEGAAILADSASKRDGHLRDLGAAVSRRTTYRLAALLTMTDYPPIDRWGAFYGQSASVAKFLIDRGGCNQFILFLERAGEHGYDVALRECYGIANVAQLDQAWRRHLGVGEAAALSGQGS
jgi:hypothetical protein